MDSLAVMTIAPLPAPLAPSPAGEGGPGFADLVEQNQESVRAAPAPPPMSVEVAPAPGLAVASLRPDLLAMPPLATGAGAPTPARLAGEVSDFQPESYAAPATDVPPGPRGPVVPHLPGLSGPAVLAAEAERPPAPALSGAILASPASSEAATLAFGAAPPAPPADGLSSPVVRQQAPLPAALAQPEPPPMLGQRPLEQPTAEVATAPGLLSPPLRPTRPQAEAPAEEDVATDMALAPEPPAAEGSLLGLPGMAPPREPQAPTVAYASTERAVAMRPEGALAPMAAEVASPAASDQPRPGEVPLLPGAEAAPSEGLAVSHVTVPPAGGDVPRVASPQREAPLALPVAESQALYGLSPIGVEAEAVSAPRAEAPSPTPPPPPARQIAPLVVALAFAPGQFSVALDPPLLGRVEIAVQREAEGHQVRILAERPETLALLERDRGELDRVLAEVGVALSEGGLSFALAGDAGGSGDSQAGRDGEAGRFPRRAPAGPVPASGPSPQSAPARSLLDLRI